MYLLKKIKAALLLFPIFSPMFGQTSLEEFHARMESMYDHTVPLVMPGQVLTEQVIFLDTREQEEYAVSHLPGARLVPYNDFRIESLEDLPKDAEIVVYCSVGYRSERIGEQLLAAGFSNVKNLYGGIFHWYYEGGQVVNMANDTTDQIHTYNKRWSQWCLKGDKVW